MRGEPLYARAAGRQDRSSPQSASTSNESLPSAGTSLEPDVSRGSHAPCTKWTETGTVADVQTSHLKTSMALAEGSHIARAMLCETDPHLAPTHTEHDHHRADPTTTTLAPTHTALVLEAEHHLRGETSTDDDRLLLHAIVTLERQCQEEVTATEAGHGRHLREEKTCHETTSLGESP